MLWYFQLRISVAERAPSRVLQVLETQRVVPRRFEARVCHGASHIHFLVEESAWAANRIGRLLQRAPFVASIFWLGAESLAAEKDLWSATAFASWSPEESLPDLNPHSDWWHAAPSTLLLNDNKGVSVPGQETDIRVRWTKDNLYFLFDSAYQQLSLRNGEAKIDAATPHLWEHDVAEIFIGRDARPFEKYLEIEVSPRGEWLTLGITADAGTVKLRTDLRGDLALAARIEQGAKRWQAFVRLPRHLLGEETGQPLRLNFFRAQGPEPAELAWQPTMAPSFHVPSSFGYLDLLPPDR